MPSSFAVLKLDLPDPPGLVGPAHPAPPPFARPLLPSRVTCGFPSPTEDYYGQSDELDLNERCVRNRVATFFVEADTGTSMVDFGIGPGDTLVVDRSITPRSGDIVMVLWDGGYMVKQLSIRGSRMQLLSGSPDHETINVPPDIGLDVWGVVTWSFRKHHRR
ncbi:MAG: LexA family protein [Pseudomonas sp.]